MSNPETETYGPYIIRDDGHFSALLPLTIMQRDGQVVAAVCNQDEGLDPALDPTGPLTWELARRIVKSLIAADAAAAEKETQSVSLKFKLEIACDTSAFEDDPTREVIRILEELFAHLRRGRDEGPLRDVNGNTVGQFSFGELDQKEA